MPKVAKIDGLPVVDATKKMVLHISLSDISRARSKDTAACAAARACVRDLGVDAARVHLSCIYLRQGKRWLRLHTPHSLRSEIVAFDRGGRFSPGTHTLSPPSESHRKDHDRHKNKKKPSGKGIKKRAPYHQTQDVRASALSEMHA